MKTLITMFAIAITLCGNAQQQTLTYELDGADKLKSQMSYGAAELDAATLDHARAFGAVVVGTVLTMIAGNNCPSTGQTGHDSSLAWGIAVASVACTFTYELHAHKHSRKAARILQGQAP